MIAEAIAKLQELWTAGQLPELFPGRDGELYTLGGKVMELPPRLMRRQVADVQSLIEFIGNDESDTRREVWITEAFVQYLPDAADNRTFAAVPLTKTRPWTLLSRLAETPQPMEHRQFVRCLYLDLRVDGALVAPWRSLDFRSMAAASGEVGLRNDRMGKQISAEVSGAAELPETVPVKLPIFATAGEREEYTISVRVDVDAAAQRLTLLPDPLEMAELVEIHLFGIAKRIREEIPDLAVYFGRDL